MGLYKRGDIWWYTFTPPGGKPVRGSAKTASRDEAEMIYATAKRDALYAAKLGIRPIAEITLDAMFARYWTEIAHKRPDYNVSRRVAEMFCTAFGGETRLSEINSDVLSAWVADRNQTCTNDTVNREVQNFRGVVMRAVKVWKRRGPEIDWKLLRLQSSEPRQMILEPTQLARLLDCLRADFHPIVEFGLASGLRVGNIIDLEWNNHVKWEDGYIEVRIKSRKPGGKVHRINLTRRLRAILAAERGKHPRFVFTYVVAGTYYDKHNRVQHRKGEIAPFTRCGWRMAFRAAVKAAGLDGFRFHDLRHMAATRVLNAPGGRLERVQKMLGHGSLAMTQRYARTTVDDVEAAMEAADSHFYHNAPPRPKKRNDIKSL